MAKAIAFLVLLLFSPAVYAATHNVGGNSGWNTGVDYGSWASGLTFAVGDSIVFNYDFTHAVDEVTQADYNSCNTANSISSDSNSPTTISLTSTGTRYFICPRSNHCGQGMKLAVTVSGGSTSPGGPSPPSGGNGPSPPSEGTTPSTPETPTSTSTPPPPAGSAASTLSGKNGLMVGGLSVLLAAMLG